MKDDEKLPEEIQISKDRGVRTAHKGGFASNDVEQASKEAEKARVETDKESKAEDE